MVTRRLCRVQGVPRRAGRSSNRSRDAQGHVNLVIARHEASRSAGLKVCLRTGGLGRNVEQCIVCTGATKRDAFCIGSVMGRERERARREAADPGWKEWLAVRAIERLLVGVRLEGFPDVPQVVRTRGGKGGNGDDGPGGRSICVCSCQRDVGRRTNQSSNGGWWVS